MRVMRCVFVLVFLALVSTERDWLSEVQTVPGEPLASKEVVPGCQIKGYFNYNVEVRSSSWIVYLVEELFWGLKYKFKGTVGSTVKVLQITDQSLKTRYEDYRDIIFASYGKHIAVPSNSIYVSVSAKTKIYVTLLEARYPNYSIGFFTSKAGDNRLTSGRRDYNHHKYAAWALGPMLFSKVPITNSADNTVSVELDMNAKVAFYLLEGPWPSCATDWPGRTIQSNHFEGMDNFKVYGTPRTAWMYIERLNAVMIGFRSKGGVNSGFDFVIAVQLGNNRMHVKSYMPVFEELYPICEVPADPSDEVTITRDCTVYSVVTSAGGRYTQLSVPHDWSMASYDSRSAEVASALSRALNRTSVRCFCFGKSACIDVGGAGCGSLNSEWSGRKVCYEVKSEALVIAKKHPQCNRNSGKYCEPKTYEIAKSEQGLHPAAMHIDVGRVSDEPVTFESELKLPPIESAEIQLVIVSNIDTRFGSTSGVTSGQCVTRYQEYFKLYKNLSYMYVSSATDTYRAGDFQTDIADTLITKRVLTVSYSGKNPDFVKCVQHLLKTNTIKWRPGALRVVVLTSNMPLTANYSLTEDAERVGAYVVSVSRSASQDFFSTVSGINIRAWSNDACWEFDGMFPNNGKSVNRVLNRAYANNAVRATAIGSVASPTVAPVARRDSVYTASVHIKPQNNSKGIFGISRLHIRGWGPREVSIYVNTAPRILDQDAVSNIERRVTKGNEHDLFARFNIKDSDENLIKVNITRLPAQGTLYWSRADKTRALKVGDVLYDKDLRYGPVYVPDYLYHGEDSFTYTASDGCVDVGPADFKVNVDYCSAILVEDYALTTKMDYKSETQVLKFEHLHDTDEADVEVEVEVVSIPPLVLGEFVNQDGERIKSVPYTFVVRNNTEIKFVVSQNVHREQNHTLKYVARRTNTSYTGYCHRQRTSEGNIQLTITKGEYTPTIRSYYPNNTVMVNVPGTTSIGVVCGNWNYDEVMSLSVSNAGDMPITIPDYCKNFSLIEGDYMCQVKWELDESNLYKYKDPVIEFVLTQSDGVSSRMSVYLSTTSRFVSIRDPRSVTVTSGGANSEFFDDVSVDPAQNYRIYIGSMPKYGVLSHRGEALKCAGSRCPEGGVAYGDTHELVYTAHSHVDLEGQWKISDGRRVLSDSFHFYMYNGSDYTNIATQAIDVVRIALPPESKNAQIQVGRGKTVDFSLEFTAMNLRNCSVCFPTSEKHRVVYVDKRELQAHADAVCTAPAESSVNLTYLHTAACPKPACSFEFWIVDGNFSSNRYSVSVKVVNSAPDARDVELTVERETALRIVVNDSFFTDDVESQPWKVKFISTSVEFGQLNISGSFAELALNQWLPPGTYLDYLSSSDDISPPKITLKFVVRDEEGLDSEPGTIAISVLSRRLQPTTTLTSVDVAQGSVEEIPWMSRKYAQTEVPQSSLYVVLKSLPKYGVLKVSGEEVTSLDQKFHEDDVVVYESDPWEWGDERDAIHYILRDNLTDIGFNELSTLKINLAKVHRIPVIDVNGMDTEKVRCVSSRCVLNLYSHENYTFRFNVSSPTVVPRNLSAEIKVTSYTKNPWELRSQGELIMSSHNSLRATIYSVPPLSVVDTVCPDDRALYGLRGNISDECMVEYQVEIGTANVSRGFPLISIMIGAMSVGDFDRNSVRYSETVRIDVIMSVLNTPPVLQTPAEVYLLEENKVSFQLNISDALSERCNETLVISAEGGTGFWTFDQDVSSCTQNSTTVVCQDTIEHYMAFLPALRFRPDSKAVSGVRFTLADNGCGGVSFDSTPVQNLSATSYTKISGSFKKTESKTKIVVAAVGSIAGLAFIAGITTYVTKRFKRVPDSNYFDVDFNSLTTASQNPLFKSAHPESTNPIYR